jgi:hypothetical protein
MLIYEPQNVNNVGDKNMVKKLGIKAIDLALKENQGQWLSAAELMYSANKHMPSRSTLMVGAVAHHLRVLHSRNQVEIRNCRKSAEYKYDPTMN